MQWHFLGHEFLLLYCFSTNERNNTDWASYLAPLGPDVKMLDEFIGSGCFPVHSEIFWRQNTSLNVKCMYMSQTPCTRSLKVVIYIFLMYLYWLWRLLYIFSMYLYWLWHVVWGQMYTVSMPWCPQSFRFYRISDFRFLGFGHSQPPVQ